MAQTIQECLDYLAAARESVEELSLAADREEQLKQDENRLKKALDTEKKYKGFWLFCKAASVRLSDPVTFACSSNQNVVNCKQYISKRKLSQKTKFRTWGFVLQRKSLRRRKQIWRRLFRNAWTIWQQQGNL